MSILLAYSKLQTCLLLRPLQNYQNLKEWEIIYGNGNFEDASRGAIHKEGDGAGKCSLLYLDLSYILKKGIYISMSSS